MTVYADEPKSAAELLARYRDAKRRLYSVPPPCPTREFAAVDAEDILAFALAAAAVTADRARESRKRAEEVRRTVGLGSPSSKARAALRAVSQRTGVPVDAISGAKGSARSSPLVTRHMAGPRSRKVVASARRPVLYQS